MTIFEAVTHTAEVCHNVRGTWTNAGYIGQTGSPTFKVNATPSASDINAVIGLTDGAQSAYGQRGGDRALQSIGLYRCLNGNAYSAASNIPYFGGTEYSFWFEVDVPAQTYSAYVTPHDGTQALIG